ncbi:MAG TPA: hypothetical protein VIF62_31370 [Labilithrix sp.]|jgi:hypothetical protein
MGSRACPATRASTRAIWLALVLAACSDKGAATHAPDAAPRIVDAGDGGSDAGSVDDAIMPTASPEELAARMRHLLEAIQQNNPDLANDVIFPRDAFAASKDLPDPQKAWEKKLSDRFRRAVDRTHNRTKNIEQAKFVSFELGHAIVQLTPRKKDFKKPLWRVKHSRLNLSVDGKPRHIDIAEMTAWRGSWYVTRLR